MISPWWVRLFASSRFIRNRFFLSFCRFHAVANSRQFRLLINVLKDVPPVIEFFSISGAAVRDVRHIGHAVFSRLSPYPSIGLFPAKPLHAWKGTHIPIFSVPFIHKIFFVVVWSRVIEFVRVWIKMSPLEFSFAYPLAVSAIDSSSVLQQSDHLESLLRGWLLGIWTQNRAVMSRLLWPLS